MPIRDPAEFRRVYCESFNSGSLDALLALYEPGIAMLPQPGSGEAVTGTDAVQQVLSGFLATNGRMDGDVKEVVRSGELALVCTDWGLTGTWAGAPLELQSARCLLDQTWG
jgi:ketosteroid isomerase-like protein